MAAKQPRGETMRVYFYGALLLAVSILLASFGSGTPRTNSTLSAISEFATVDTVITNVSTDDFDHALAKITSVNFIGAKRGHKPLVAGADTVDSLALQDSIHLFADKTKVGPGDDK